MTQENDSQRIYTEADLPKVEDAEWSVCGPTIYGKQWSVEFISIGCGCLMVSCEETESDAIRAAREWFKKIQAAEVPE